MADGAHTLATIWESAWKAGNGNAIAAGKLKAIPQSTLSALYLKKEDSFKSLNLDAILPVLK